MYQVVFFSPHTDSVWIETFEKVSNLLLFLRWQKKQNPHVEVIGVTLVHSGGFWLPGGNKAGA